MEDLNKILITGCNGFIGQSLSENFNRKNVQVIRSSRNIKKEDYDCLKIPFKEHSILDAINLYKPEIIVHAAGTASVKESFFSPEDDFNNSVIPYITLLEAVRKSKQRPKIFYLSSASVYGNTDAQNIKENEEIKPISPYGYHKFICEKISEEYSKLYNLDVINIRLFSVFGRLQKKLLIWELYRQFRESDKVIIKGTGNETRDYIHVDEITKFIIKLYKVNTDQCLNINIASGEGIKIISVAEKIKSIMKSKKKIVCLGNILKGDPVYWQADINLLRELAGPFTILDIEKGLKRCIENWELENENSNIN